MRLFLSTFAVNDEQADARTIQQKQSTFHSTLTSQGIDYYDGSHFTDYPTIFHELDKSSVLVAFIDDFWITSTWKIMELFYGAGLSSENEGSYIDSPLDCYVHCPGIKNPNIERLLACENAHIFDGTWNHFIDLTAPDLIR